MAIGITLQWISTGICVVTGIAMIVGMIADWEPEAILTARKIAFVGIALGLLGKLL